MNELLELIKNLETEKTSLKENFNNMTRYVEICIELDTLYPAIKTLRKYNNK